MEIKKHFPVQRYSEPIYRSHAHMWAGHHSALAGTETSAKSSQFSHTAISTQRVTISFSSQVCKPKLLRWQ